MHIYPLKHNDNEYPELMDSLNVSAAGIKIMKNRFQFLSFLVKDISIAGANAIKQEVLALGGEAAVPSGAINCSVPKGSLFFSLRKDKIQEFISVCRMQWWKLPEIAEFIENYLKRSVPWFDYKGDGRNTKRASVMGILNTTPDSFSDGGNYVNIDNALHHAENMLRQGVDIIDIGGESTRPGSDFVDTETELLRTIPVIERIKANFPQAVISIDTTKGDVAEKAINAGASIINDISGLTFDESIAKVAAEKNAAIVLMHIKGKPKEMQLKPEYDDIILEMTDFFSNAIDKAVDSGVKREMLMLDPGFGFGKNDEHNMFVIKHLEMFHSFMLPILVGVSRKSTIGRICNSSHPLDRVVGTSLINLKALEKGAAVIRVHDIKEAMDTLSIHTAFEEAKCF